MKKLLAMALALLMVAVLLPVTAMAEENVVNVTTANATTINYGATSNVTYKFAAGNYGTLQAFLRSSENVTFIAEDGATFDRLEIGYHAGQDGSLANKTNSTLTVQGFKVTGDLFINAADQKVIVQNNTAGNITIKTHHIDNMDIQVLNNEITGGETAFKYGIYIVPNTTNYDLTITGNKLSNIKSHAIGVQGCGDGSAVTAAKSVTVSNNNFISYGVGGDSNRAAFKIWEDTKFAPTDSATITNDAATLVASIKDSNTFSSSLGKNCVAALIYDLGIVALDPPTPPEEEGPSTIVIITPSTPTSPEFLSGANQTVGVGAKATFRIDKDFVDFMSVAVDGITLDKTQYKAWSGSTYVELLSSYMKTLSEGTHTLSAYFNGATATTAFTISKTVPAQQNPATGANDFVGAAAALAAVSLLGMAVASRKK